MRIQLVCLIYSYFLHRRCRDHTLPTTESQQTYGTDGTLKNLVTHTTWNTGEREKIIFIQQECYKLITAITKQQHLTTSWNTNFHTRIFHAQNFSIHNTVVFLFSASTLSHYPTSVHYQRACKKKREADLSISSDLYVVSQSERARQKERVRRNLSRYTAQAQNWANCKIAYMIV